MPGHRWTPDEARSMVAKSILAKRLKLLARPVTPPTPTPPNGHQPHPPEVEDDGYVTERLTRVRAQLDKLDGTISLELKKKRPDGQRLNWLAQAQERLSDQERELAGRPRLSTVKPAARRQPRSPDAPLPYSVARPEPPVVVQPVTDTPTGGSQPEPQTPPNTTSPEVP
jgi:hypothetical protein